MNAPPNCDSLDSPIVRYIEQQPEKAQPHLYELYHLIKKILPDATEKMAWRMPTFWQGQNIIHFAAFKDHLGLYPSQELPDAWIDKLEGYKKGKGSVQFPYDKPLPIPLLTELVTWCKEHRIT